MISTWWMLLLTLKVSYTNMKPQTLLITRWYVLNFLMNRSVVSIQMRFHLVCYHPAALLFFSSRGWGYFLQLSLPRSSSWIFAHSHTELRTDNPELFLLKPGRNHFLHDFSTTIDKTTGTPAQTAHKLRLILDNQLLCESHTAAKSWSCRFSLCKSCQIRQILTMNTDQPEL